MPRDRAARASIAHRLEQDRDEEREGEKEESEAALYHVDPVGMAATNRPQSDIARPW